MLNKIRNFSYGEARYHVMKEIDTQGDIGRILSSIVPQLSIIMIRVCEQIDKLHAWNPGEPENDLQVSQDTINMFVAIQQAYPTLVLTEDTLEWNDWMSAWCAMVHEFCSAFGGYANYKLSMNEQDPMANSLLQELGGIEATLAPTMRLAELGAGYNDLLQASAEIVKELKSWRQSRPASLRLSQAYLASLGLVKPETKKGPDCNCGPQGPQGPGNNPPPPPPPAGDNGGNNPPPPPPPPPAN